MDESTEPIKVSFSNNKFSDWKVGDQIRVFKLHRNKYDCNSLTFDYESSFEMNKSLELLNWYNNWVKNGKFTLNTLDKILKDDNQLRVNNQGAIPVSCFKGRVNAVKLSRIYYVCNRSIPCLILSQRTNAKL